MKTLRKIKQNKKKITKVFLERKDYEQSTLPESSKKKKFKQKLSNQTYYEISLYQPIKSLKKTKGIIFELSFS